MDYGISWKGYRRIFLIVITIICLIAIYYFRNLSFTKYNKKPLYICNKYLEETYNEKFTLLEEVFYLYRNYYTWEMIYEDENGLKFNMYYLHSREGSEGFFYLFFDKDNGYYGIRDYYWQVKLEEQFGEIIDLESLKYEFSSSSPRYCFDVRTEDDIRETANIITITLNYILNNVKKLPEDTMGGYDINYLGKRSCFIAINSEMEDLKNKDEKEIFQYVYDEIYNGFADIKHKQIYRNEKDFWNVDDLYGGWKVTRVICTAKGGYGELPLGNDIGRYIYISEKTVTDSKQHEEAAAEGKVCYNMKILKSEKNEYSMYENEMIGEFQRYSSIILEKAGITDQLIYEFIFYADKDSEDDLFYANNLRLFSYRQNDKNMLVMNFPYGSYILEKDIKQEKGEEVCGKWMVERLVSRGTGEKSGIDFIAHYGEIYQFASEKIVMDDKEYSMSFIRETIDKKRYEEKNGIKDGLGIENQEIEVFHIMVNGGYYTEMIPLNEDEIIMKIDRQWFLLRHIEQYIEPNILSEKVLTGEWKPTLLIAAEDVDQKLEANTYTNPFWWYGNCVKMDTTGYIVDVSEWKTETIQAGNLGKKYNLPSNVMGMFEETDVLHIAVREINHVEEIYIIIDENMMIRGRNGLWLRLEKVDKTYGECGRENWTSSLQF